MGFLKKILPATLLLFSSVFIFGLVIWLSEENFVVFTTPFYASLFFYLIYLLISFFFYKKEVEKDRVIEELNNENIKLLKEYMSFKEDFLEYFMMWVHQIKTPITSARLAVNILDNSDVKKHLESSLFSIERYTEMVLDYLKLVDKDSNLDISNVNLDAVTAEILKKYSMLFINSKIKLEYEPMNKTVISDYKWLSILLEQLISNAVKYTKKGTVSIYFDSDKNALAVKDTGIGIKAEDIPRIFERGYSGFNGRLNRESSGIGLYIVKKIAEKINVNVSVESEVGKGSTFYVEFQKEGLNLTKM